MSERLSNTLSVVLVVCAVSMTGLFARREFFPPSVAAQAEVKVRDWRRYAIAGSLLGPGQAELRVVEFSDFQCPFCASASSSLRALRARYPGRLTVVYRHFPLEIHQHAFAAAVASECAGRQGRFEAFHDALFAHQDSIPAEGWGGFATRAGVPDGPAFASCVRDPRLAGVVRRDMAAAREVGVRATPSFVFDGKMVSGADAVPQIERWVAASLK
ncbi:MAG TPA: DsbA family protein [Longimicrobium sp.]|jgi:protein-disulfide isomerase|nr:DsbA family protein [Longimicrobium sp.]